MSPWLKPAQQSPTPHYPDPTFLHIARNALIFPQIYGWLLITSLTTASPVDKFEGQPALGYTVKEQEVEKRGLRYREPNEGGEGDVSLSDRTSQCRGRHFIALPACDVWVQAFCSTLLPFVWSPRLRWQSLSESIWKLSAPDRNLSRSSAWSCDLTEGRFHPRGTRELRYWAAFNTVLLCDYNMWWGLKFFFCVWVSPVIAIHSKHPFKEFIQFHFSISDFFLVK